MTLQCINNKYLEPLFLFTLILFFYLFSLQYEIYEGGADNYIHYRISRYAFNYPGLFLDHWGKPVFTLLTAPFAQLGFNGMLLFNSICGVFTGYFIWKTAAILGNKNSWIAAIICFSSPIYFIMLASAMTEVLFGFILVFFVYLFLKEKYIASSIVVSFLFLIRTEAYIFYPVIAFLFLYKKQLLSVLLLLTGFIFYSVIGYFYYGDIFWLINQNPYKDTSLLYGKGDFLFFVFNYDEIFGNVFFILLITGLLYSLCQFISTLIYSKKILEHVLLIDGLFILYFFAHSYVWWTGTGASAGLIRVMAAVIPMAAIVAGRPIIFWLGRIKYQTLAILVSILISILLLFSPFLTYSLPFKYSEIDKTIIASVNWFKSSEYSINKIYYYHPMYYYLLNRNPYNEDEIKELIDERSNPEKSVKTSEIVFYDTQLAPREGAMPLKNLMRNKYFKLINYFEPIEETEIRKGENFSVYVFERVNKNEYNNDSILQQLIKSKSTIKTVHFATINNHFLSEEFFPILETELKNLNDFLDAHEIHCELSGFFYCVSGCELLMVTSIENQRELKVYHATHIVTSENIYQHFFDKIKLNHNTLESDKLKIYLWNKSLDKINCQIDSIHVKSIKKTY